MSNRFTPPDEPDISNKTLDFPSESIEKIFNDIICDKCRTVATPPSGTMFKCQQCNAMFRVSSINKTFKAKNMFKDADGQIACITFFNTSSDCQTWMLELIF